MRHNERIVYLHPDQLSRAHLPAWCVFTCAVCTSGEVRERAVSCLCGVSAEVP